MPLNLQRPRAEPTLGRRRTADEIAREERERYSESSIVLGLRSQGGPWVQREPEEQRRIDHHKRAYEQSTGAVKAHVSPTGWSYPTREETISITSVALSKGHHTYTRSVEPRRIEVAYDESIQCVRISMVVEEFNPSALWSQQMITFEEMTRYASDATEVIDTMLGSMYRDLVEDAERRRHARRFDNSAIKPMTH